MIDRRRLTGIADEGGSSLGEQIALHRALGWETIELRSVDGIPIAGLDAAAREAVAARLADEGVRVVALASGIGNWGGSVRDDFERDLRELDALGAMARRTGARLVRIMSYPNDGLEEPAWRAEVLRRIARLAEVARDRGITLVHENCHGWAAADSDRALALVDAAGGAGLALLFDVGNAVYNGHDGPAYLARVLPHVAHVHVKDARASVSPAGGRSVAFTWPGEGEARLLDCVAIAMRAGYDGMLSMEPHLAYMPHDASVRRSDEERRAAYLEYGRRLEALLVARDVPLPASAARR